MLIIEQMKSEHFSDAEQTLVDYMTENPQLLENMTTTALAQITHTNPTSLIRVAKKLGFKGWTDLKDAYLKEWHYLNSNYNSIDANLPFEKQDNLLSIANKLATLEHNTIQDTLSLLDYQNLMQAQEKLLKAKEIKIFGSHTNAMISQDFVTKMRRINRNVSIASTFHYIDYEAYHSTEDTCAIVISYTGENDVMLKCIDMLRERGSSIISLTSIGDNTISKLSDVTLHITTREKLYSKIANFTSNTSIIYLLNLLYAMVFTHDYDVNLDHIIEVGQIFDSRRISSDIMRENKTQ
ncbi:MurR/RpiR family transcriptional regulator [Ruoffia sp. FAM 20858]|uniref:MurR/RpiR family transcriptional regulator n=1 Tax=Ruoffia sp. FAM 20858 TaxID=3259516 RepID=UPI0038891429